MALLVVFLGLSGAACTTGLAIVEAPRLLARFGYCMTKRRTQYRVVSAVSVTSGHQLMSTSR
jgi:hypothetical protein